MKEILNTIIVNLVDDKDAVEVNEINGTQSVVFEVKVAENDMGKIIGNGCSRDCGTVRIYMKNQRKVFQSLTLILQFGLNMIVPIVMCTLLGAWLGKKYGMPIITVPLFIMGALAGFNNIFKMAKKIYGQGDEGKRDHVEKTK